MRTLKVFGHVMRWPQKPFSGCDRSFVVNRMVFLPLLMLVQAVIASWLTKEDRLCNLKPDSGPLPHTGFKIHRQYKLNWVPPLSMHFMAVSHCDHGKVDYQKTLRTSSSSDIDWEKPFCLFKPDLGSRLKLKPEDTIGNVEGKGGSERDEVPRESESEVYTSTGTPRKGVWEVIKHKIDKLLQKVTGGSRVQYWGERKMLHLEDMQNSNIGAALEWESRNLVCYKMARKRKYARRNFLFYMPYTFVGVLYECPISSETKHAIFQNFTNTKFLQSFDFSCDKALAVPVCPLIADDSTKQWFTNSRSRLSTTQHIPYLTTPSLLDVRFAASNTLDMHGDTWASKVDVNEDYNYSEADISLISETVAWCADYLNRLLIRPSFKVSKFNSLRSHELESEDDLFGKMDIDQRLLLALLGLNELEALFHLKAVQERWDERVE